jgi:transaldolase
LIFRRSDAYLLCVETNEDLFEKIHDFILEKAKDLAPTPAKERAFSRDTFWLGLKEVGTEPWLDTGDIDAAAKLWSREFTALTTNNTLLNKEVQKGIYDGVITAAAVLLASLEPEAKVIEIAFILNALHGLRLVHAFAARVSVELHTATADDAEAAIAYGRRFHRISPESFIVKVPFTAAGLIAARKLRQEWIPVNLTLGFSARQNYLAAAFARPSYVNVFLGRLGAYMQDNSLGDGLMVGEKATLASQRAVAELTRAGDKRTLQIAASMRSASQLRDLAGVDVMTIPTATAAEARAGKAPVWESRRDAEYAVSFAQGVDPKRLRVSTLWDISDEEKALASSFAARPPSSPEELVRRAHELGARDIFPLLAEKDKEVIAADGKIPKHVRWEKRIAKGELAVDTLLNLAGLASFTADQRALDQRIRRLIGL